MVAPSSRRQNTGKFAQKRPFLPTAQAGQVLLDLAVTQYLTIGQVVRLYLSPNSLRFAQKRMSKLTAEGYCQQLFLQRYKPSGSAARVFTLAEKGREYAVNHDYPVAKHYRPSEEDERNPLYLDHAIAISDVYVSLKRWARQQPAVSVDEFFHERFLHGLPKVKVNGRERLVIPDAAAVLTEQAADGRYLHPLTLEVDLGTEKQVKWREKILGLLAFAESPGYRELFGTDAIRIAVVTPDDEARAKSA